MVNPSDKQRIEEARQADWKRVSSLDSYTPDELSFLEGFTAGAYYEHNFQSERIAALEKENQELKHKLSGKLKYASREEAIEGITAEALKSPEATRKILIDAGIIKTTRKCLNHSQSKISNKE